MSYNAINCLKPVNLCKFIQVCQFISISLLEYRTAANVSKVNDVFNPYVPSRPVHPYQLDEPISSFMGVWCTFFFILFYFLSKFLLINSVEPDQTPRSAASDLGLHCLPRSLKRDTRPIWVKQYRKGNNISC